MAFRYVSKPQDWDKEPKQHNMVSKWAIYILDKNDLSTVLLIIILIATVTAPALVPPPHSFDILSLTDAHFISQTSFRSNLRSSPVCSWLPLSSVFLVSLNKEIIVHYTLYNGSNINFQWNQHCYALTKLKNFSTPAISMIANRLKTSNWN